MTDTTYNGWANYATWRVNLEMIDGIDPRDMGWSRMDKADLADALKEYCIEILEADAPSSKRTSDPLVLSYALAFLSDVNWREIADAMIENYDMAESEEDESEEA